MNINLAGIFLRTFCVFWCINVFAELDKPVAGAVNLAVQPSLLNASRIDMLTNDPVVREHLKRHNKENNRQRLKTPTRPEKRTERRKTKRHTSTIQRIKFPVSSATPLIVNRTNQVQFRDMTRRGGDVTGRASDLIRRERQVELLRRSATRGRP